MSDQDKRYDDGPDGTGHQWQTEMFDRLQTVIHGATTNEIDGVIQNETDGGDNFRGPYPIDAAHVIVDVLVIELVRLCTSQDDEDLLMERYKYLRSCYADIVNSHRRQKH